MFKVLLFISKKQAHLPCVGENKGFMLHTFARKTKYQVTKLAGRAKLSRLLLQRIIEFKMNENRRKTPVINLYVIFGP